MKQLCVRLAGMCALLLVLVGSAAGQQNITEPSTELSFPSTVTFSAGGKDFSLQATGTAVRKKLVFKVYGMAHYMQDPVRGSEDAIFKAILEEGKAKQITMTFVREVTPVQITDAYRDGVKENASKEEQAAIASDLGKFLGFFTDPVKENDTFILRWLPGGTISATIQGKEKGSITNPTFARVLWTIWFGEDSIVDRDDLVERLTGK